MSTAGRSIGLLRRYREQTQAAADEAHRALLNEVIRRVEEDPDTNVRELARAAGIAHGTVYNELARRQDRADHLSTNGDVPAAAPHDDDRDAALEPTPKLSEAQRDALKVIAAGGTFAGGELFGRARRTVEILRDKGLVERDVLELTRAGRELAERGGAA